RLLEEGAAGRGGMIIVSGDGGVGKSRLLKAAVAEAEQKGWCCLVGRAYPVETGIPYSPFADAFVPMLRAMEPNALATLTRGSEADLRRLFPAIGGLAPEEGAYDPAEVKARLLWNFTQFVSRLAARKPVLLVLD